MLVLKSQLRTGESVAEIATPNLLVGTAAIVKSLWKMDFEMMKTISFTLLRTRSTNSVNNVLSRTINNS